MKGCLEYTPLHEPKSASLIVSSISRIFSLNFHSGGKIRLYVTVENAVLVHVLDRVQNLKEVELHSALWKVVTSS